MRSISRNWLKEYHRQYYIRNRDLICARSRARWQADKPAHQAACRRRNQTVRNIARQGLGNQCECCGETCLSMLDVDHVRNDGNSYRKKNSSRGVYAIYRDVIASNFDRNIYQLLCRNCNWSKYINSGTCEHQIVRGSALRLVI